MMDISKYMATHENVFKPNIEIIKNETLSLQMAKMIANGFNGVCEITEEQWKALGTPPATRVGEDYHINLGDPKTVGLLWMRSANVAIQLSLHATGDISSSVCAISYDNSNEDLADHEAMAAINQMIRFGLNCFKTAKTWAESELEE